MIVISDCTTVCCSQMDMQGSLISIIRSPAYFLVLLGAGRGVMGNQGTNPGGKTVTVRAGCPAVTSRSLKNNKKNSVK